MLPDPKHHLGQPIEIQHHKFMLKFYAEFFQKPYKNPEILHVLQQRRPPKAINTFPRHFCYK